MIDYQRLSKFMSLVLRHKPEAAYVTLDSDGWCSVDSLLEGIGKAGRAVTRQDLEHVVSSDEKGRYKFSDDGTKIRANQGHSLSVDLKLKSMTPPDELYHGTVDRFLEAIKSEGLKKMNRQHVHLSPDRQTAMAVGGRRGKPVVLVINAKKMHEKGIPFYISDNGVWLVDSVAPEFIDFV